MENRIEYDLRLSYLQLSFRKRKSIGEEMIPGSFSDITKSESDRSIDFLLKIKEQNRYGELFSKIMDEESNEVEIKYATFFGGAKNDTTTQEYLDSISIGQMLALKGYTVKCGGYKGLMEAVSKGVRNANGNVIGYTCKTYKSTVGNEFLTQTVVCDNIYDRLKNLIEESQIFIAQAGGIGTLSELCLVLDEARKQKIKPKIFLIGINWEIIFTYIEEIMTENDFKMLTFCRDFIDFENKFKEIS